MKLAFAVVLALLAASLAPPARAGFPVSLRAYAGAGLGSAHHRELDASGLFGTLGADLTWRRRPGRAWALSFEWSGGPLAGTKTLHGIWPSQHLRTDEHWALLAGREWSRADSGVGPYFQVGMGLGQVTSELTRGRPRSLGPAASGTVGVRIAPDPGPLGFVLGLHSGHVFTEHARSHVTTLFFGFNIHPR